MWSLLWLTCLRVGFWCQHLIWIFGSKLILTNDHASATLWVLDMCPIVGFIPLMIISIIVSLSSNMCNWDSPWAECAFEVTWSTCDNRSTSRFPFCLGLDLLLREQFLAAGLVGGLVLLDERNASITTSQKSGEGNPSIRSPASNEMISDSVELWDTDVSFLHIQLTGRIVRLPKTHRIPFEVDFESPTSPAKSESWKKPNRQCRAVLATWEYCR